jgi:hypothetical protein
MPDQRAGEVQGHGFVPDLEDDEFCDVCGHPVADHAVNNAEPTWDGPVFYDPTVTS